MHKRLFIAIIPLLFCTAATLFSAESSIKDAHSSRMRKRGHVSDSGEIFGEISGRALADTYRPAVLIRVCGGKDPALEAFFSSLASSKWGGESYEFEAMRWNHKNTIQQILQTSHGFPLGIARIVGGLLIDLNEPTAEEIRKIKRDCKKFVQLHRTLN